MFKLIHNKSRGVYVESLGCSVISLEYDYISKTCNINIAKNGLGGFINMGSCIKLVESIDSDALVIQTYLVYDSNSIADILYKKEAGSWKCYLP